MLCLGRSRVQAIYLCIQTVDYVIKIIKIMLLGNKLEKGSICISLRLFPGILTIGAPWWNWKEMKMKGARQYVLSAAAH